MKGLIVHLPSDNNFLSYDKLNATAWDLLAEQHMNTRSYDNLLLMHPLEVLGDWALEWARKNQIRTVCHIACHLGLEAIAWARSGFISIGIDRSSIALSGAQKYSKSAEIKRISWCLADINKELPIRNQVIDLVWLSHGTIYWYPDIGDFFNRISKIIRPGGLLLIEEIHPISLIVSTLQCEKHPTLDRYSFNGIPLEKDVKMQYAGGRIPFPAHIWVHSLGDIISKSVKNGLIINELNELGWTTFKQFPFLKEAFSNRYSPHNDCAFHPPLSFRLAMSRQK